MENNVIIDLKNISVSFDGEPILKNLNLYIRDKEFITLLGPSGCGKTTTLRIIGGFLEPDEGTVIFDGKKINGVPPHKRQVNTIFQRYALFPHLDVYENIAFGLRVKKWPEKKIRDKVNEMLALVNLKGFKRRKIASLSGGQQQRVAIARALANEPRVLLLDEPLGALDLKLRKDMQVELKNIQQRMGITFIYVNHDQEEALSMSDTVVVMLLLDIGRIMNVGFEQIYVLANSAVYSTGDVISTYVYRLGIGSGRFSLTTAIGLFQSAIGFVMIISCNALSRKIADKGLW